MNKDIQKIIDSFFKENGSMKTFKEIIAILFGAILMFGGLGVILNAEILNAIILIGGLMIVGGMGCFVYIFLGILKENKKRG